MLGSIIAQNTNRKMGIKCRFNFNDSTIPCLAFILCIDSKLILTHSITNHREYFIKENAFVKIGLLKEKHVKFFN